MVGYDLVGVFYLFNAVGTAIEVFLKATALFWLYLIHLQTFSGTAKLTGIAASYFKFLFQIYVYEAQKYGNYRNL